MGNSFLGIGEYDSAISVWEEVLALRTDNLGPHHPDTLRSLNSLIWVKVAPTPDGSDPPISAEELEKMRGVCKQYPTGMYLNTLGVTEYRMGNFAEAIAAAEQSLEKFPKEMNLPSPLPDDLAILAMSHHKLGDTDKAHEYRKQLNEAMKLDAFKADEECLSFLAEVNELFESQEGGRLDLGN